MWIIYVLMIIEIGIAQFPEDVYVTQDEELITDLLKRHSFEETTVNNTEEIRVTMENLMPYPCDLENEEHHYLRDFGHIRTPVQTFTEVLTTQGRYYQSPEEYDENCACPPVYQVIWNPARGKHKILAAQLRQGFIPQETTQIRVEERQMYTIFYENNNQVMYRASNIMTVVGKEDPRLIHQRLTNFRQRFLYGMRNHRHNSAVEYKALAQHNWQSTIKRAVANYTDSQGHIRVYRYLQVTDLDVMTQLKMIDHMITILYETYEWVEWKVTAINSNEVDPDWRRIERQEPCQIATEESWGIKYTPGTRGTIRVCDFREYSYMLNASEYGFDIVMPIGNFEPANLSQDFRYDLKELNNVVQWNFVESAIGRDAMIKVEFTHGPVRERPTQIYSLVSNSIHSRFHKNFLWSTWWKMGRTKLMITEQDEMCERTEYTEFVRRLGENQRPITPTDQYRTLRVMHERQPQNCQLVYANDASCRKPRGEGQCQYAVGRDMTSYLRSEVMVDPWKNRAAVPQGQICFDKIIGMNQLLKEDIPSNTLEVIGIKREPELRYIMKQNLRTFSQLLDDKGQNQASAMNRALALMAEKISEMRSQGLLGSHQENLRARYAARRAVTRIGIEGINWEQKFNMAQENINRTLVKMRKIELEISDATEDAKGKIAAYYLYQRIRLMLPHLEKITQLEKLNKYRIRLKKGNIYWQIISRFQKIRRNRGETHDRSPRDPVMTTPLSGIIGTDRTTRHDTKETQPSTTLETKGQNEQMTYSITTFSIKQGDKVFLTQKPGKVEVQKDEYLRIKQLISNELIEHQLNQEYKEKEESPITKTKNKSNENRVEILLITLIGIASIIGAIFVISITYYLLNKNKRKRTVNMNKTRKLINKTRNFPFTDNN